MRTELSRSDVYLGRDDVPAPQRAWWKQEWVRAALLVAVVFVVYLPAWHGAPVYDDTDHLTPPELRSLAGLKRIWTELGVVSQYYPVTHTVFWLEHRLWGDAMLGYHLVNLLLHATAALLLARVMRRLEVPSAWFAAALFALHPVMVESVAWISEIKNTLSGACYLGALLLYLRFDRERRSASYVLALLLFVVGLLSKGVIATWPAAVLVIFWWKRGRLSWPRDVRPLIPFFILAVTMGLLTAWVERNYIGAQGGAFELTWAQRVLVAGRVVWFYLGHLLWPAELTFIYPRWQVSSASAAQWVFPVAAVAAVGTAWIQRGRTRAPLASILFFVGTLTPVLGFLNVYPFRYSYVADHYVYLAALGVLVPIAAGAAIWLRRMSRSSRVAGLAVAGVLLLTLAAVSWSQSRMYRDDETLWRETIARNPGCALAYNNLSADLIQRGETARAEQLARTGIALEPNFAESHNSLGMALRRQGKIDEAVVEYRRAIAIRPELAQVHCNLAYALQSLGKEDEALEQFEHAVRLRPEFIQARLDLGAALIRARRIEEGTTHLRAALQLDPKNGSAWAALGNALLQKGDLTDAANALENALRFQPENASAWVDLGNVRVREGNLDVAVVAYERALASQPDFDLAHYNLACAQLRRGDASAALMHLRKAVSLNPQLAPARLQLGNALLQFGRADEAAEAYRQALELAPELFDAHVNLASVLFGKGDVAGVIDHSRQALRLQPDRPDLLASLAWLLATCSDESVRSGSEAVRLAERANTLTRGADAMVLRALAAAYAESSRFAEAVAAADQALQVADAARDASLAGVLRAQLKRHQAGEPIRETRRSPN